MKKMMKAAIIMAAFLLPTISVSAKPNILLIIADDMGLDASNCYAIGSQQAPMPNLEKMCQDGIVFENAYAAPTCSPTRATILSGQYGFRTGVGAPVAPDGSDELSVDTPTLFDALNATDYASNVIGKWHVTGRRSGYDAPAQMGVSDYFGLYSGGIRDYFNWSAIENGQEVQIEGYSTTVLTDRAINWIEDQDKSWFLWLAYNAPHAPFHLPPNELHSFNDLDDSEAAAKQNPLPYYQAMLEALDTEIGRLLSSLDAEEKDNTIVIFIGDNGTPNQVIGDLYGNHRAKGTIYDSGTRVPMVVTGPGIYSGRSDAFVNTTDLNKTIAKLAGASTNAQDSIDFSPVLYGGEGSRDYVYVEYFTDRQTRGGGVYGWSLRRGNFKIINPKDQPAELYDLENDPLEQIDLLAGVGSDQAKAISQALMNKRATLLATEN